MNAKTAFSIAATVLASTGGGACGEPNRRPVTSLDAITGAEAEVTGPVPPVETTGSEVPTTTESIGGTSLETTLDALSEPSSSSTASTTMTTMTTMTDTGGEVCQALSVKAKPAFRPADILLVIDNSGSMADEMEAIQNSLNSFSESLGNSGIDHHVVLLSRLGTTNDLGVCIPAPVGSGNCPAADTHLPAFLHIDRTIGSHDALSQLLASQEQWINSTREDSMKHILVVTDDESSLSGEDFTSSFQYTGEGFLDFTLHAIIGTIDPNDKLVDCPDGGPNATCCENVAAEGTVYRGLADQTNGKIGSICQPNFAPILEAIATSVLEQAAIPCALDIPESGARIDFGKVNVVIQSDGSTQPLVGVGGIDECEGDGMAWYYQPDVNKGDPTLIVLCPSACEAAQQVGVELAVEFGCKTIVPG